MKRCFKCDRIPAGKSILILVLGLWVLCLSNLPAQAENSEESGTQTIKLDELVITATRKEEKIRNLPGSVAVISRDEIEQSDAKEVPELLKSIPGVTFGDSYGNGTQFSFGLRGVNPGRCNKVLVMVNGVPMNSGSTGTVFWRDLPPLEQIEKIEVVKGPVSTLYGGFGIGGAVNIITKRGPITPKTKVKTTFGSKSESRTSVETGGNLEGKFSYQVGYSHGQGDGFREHSEFEADKVSTKLGLSVTERADVELDVSYVKNEHQVPGKITLEDFEEDPTQAESLLGMSDLERVLASLVYRHDVWEDDNLRVSCYYHTYELDYKFPSYSTGHYFYDVDTLGGEFQYTLNHSLFGRNNTLIFGPTVRFDSAETQAYTVTSDGETTDTLKADNVADPMFWAMYIQDEYHVTDRLIMTLGIRYDEAQFENEDHLNPDNDVETDMDAWSPKFGLAYKLFDHTTLFANVGKGFAPPTVSKLYGTSGNPDLDPETATNYEVSMRTMPVSWFDLTTTIYQMDVEDEIIGAEQPDGSSKNVNAGETRHRGVEAELNLYLPWGISPFLNATFQEVVFTDHKVYSSSTGVTTVYDGNKLPDTPDFRMTAGINYRHPLGISWRISAFYEGDKYADEANEYEDPSYTVWDTRLEYNGSFKRMSYSVYGSVKNLFDKTYYADGTVTRGTYKVYPSPPRTFLVGASLSI